jgi:hypothetical protein
MSTCGTPAKESTFRAELTKLEHPDRIRRIDYQLAANRVALASRNESLLALRGDFDALTLDFWRGFGRGLGFEDPERTIAAQKERTHSVGHISGILVVVALTTLAAVGARTIPELVVLIAVAGIVALCVIVVAPLRQIARARRVAAVLGREQEPFWLIGGSIASSNLGVTPPQETKWWWKDQTVFVFVRHLAVRRLLSDGASGRDLRTMVERATIRAISRAPEQGHSLDFALTLSDFQPDDGEA